MSKHIGHGINFIPHGDGSVKVVKLWKNLPEGVEYEVHLSKEEWRDIVSHCDHHDPVPELTEKPMSKLTKDEVSEIIKEPKSTKKVK